MEKKLKKIWKKMEGEEDISKIILYKKKSMDEMDSCRKKRSTEAFKLFRRIQEYKSGYAIKNKIYI